MSYYVVIDGNKYDRELLDLAKEFAANDVEVSFAEARRLWEACLDGPGATDCEKATLQYCLKELRFADKAKSFLQEKLKDVNKGSYYKQIKGLKYAKDLLDMADMASKAGPMDRTSAVALIQKAKDGPGITECEQRTLEYVYKHSNLSDDARSLLREAVTPKYKGKSYYVKIRGVVYERLLLEQADEAATTSGAGIGLAGAKVLWDSAIDGRGVTDCERRTLEHILAVHKCTPEAREYLHRMLLSTHVLPTPDVGSASEVEETTILPIKEEEEAKQKREQEEANAAAKEAARKEVEEQKKREKQRVLQKEERRLAEAEEKFGSIFDKIDVNGDGVMTKAELQKYVSTVDEYALIDMGIQKWETFIKEADLDGDGKLSRDEFVVFFSFGDVELDPDHLFGALFDTIDVSDDGILQREEVLNYQWYKNPRVFGMFGVSDFTELVAAMDVDGDGNVSKDEFISYMKRCVGESAKEVSGWKGMLQAGRTWRKDCGIKPKFQSCWDFAYGYCCTSCRWAHDQPPDVADLSERRKRCAKMALDLGLNLSHEAHLQLQSLPEDEETELIRAVAPGGQFSYVQAKNIFICQEVRRRNWKKSGTWGQKRQRVA